MRRLALIASILVSGLGATTAQADSVPYLDGVEATKVRPARGWVQARVADQVRYWQLAHPAEVAGMCPHGVAAYETATLVLRGEADKYGVGGSCVVALRRTREFYGTPWKRWPGARKALIRHEVGHALGIDHDEVDPIMNSAKLFIPADLT